MRNTCLCISLYRQNKETILNIKKMKTKNGLVMVSGYNTKKTNIFGRLTEYGKLKLRLKLLRKTKPAKRNCEYDDYDF